MGQEAVHIGREAQCLPQSPTAGWLGRSWTRTQISRSHFEGIFMTLHRATHPFEALGAWSCTVPPREKQVSDPPGAESPTDIAERLYSHPTVC